MVWPQQHFKRSCTRISRLPLLIWLQIRLIFQIKIILCPFCGYQKPLWGNPLDFHNTGKLLGLIFPCKQGDADIKFKHDACKRPHIDRTVIVNSQNDLWCSVVSALNVCVKLMSQETSGSKVNHFDL